MPPTQKRLLSSTETQAFVREKGLETAAAAAFAFKDVAVGQRYALHSHKRHQLLYATRGMATLEVADATFLLPPQRAAFIPAGVRHVTSMGNAQGISLFFDARLVHVASREVRVLDVTPLLRELIQFATRWPASRPKADRLANAYFLSFGLLLEEWLTQTSAYRLPRGRSKPVQQAIALTIEHCAELDLPSLCRKVGVSERSLRRHLHAETGLGFRELTCQARVLRAMALLADGQNSVTETALAVGFESPSAFAKAFARVAGESPRAFRERVQNAKIPSQAAPRRPKRALGLGI
jgi:AraC-like DNA-binding protein/mannose-6-phosphate isomerase-like protein (cupin superfamily)